MNKKLIPLKCYMPLCQGLFTVLSFELHPSEEKTESIYKQKATSLEANALFAEIFLMGSN